MDIIEKLLNSTDFKNLTHRYKRPTAKVNFNDFIYAANFLMR